MSKDRCRTCPKEEDNVDAVPGACCEDEPVSGVPASGPSAQEPTPTPESAPEGQSAPATTEAPFSPRLWDVPPDTVTHIAGAQLNMFGRYLRQRCDWCGVIIIEYDLARVMVPVDQPGPPPMWPVGALVRVDRVMSAVVEAVEEDGHTKLPMDSCAFDPFTQVNPPLPKWKP